MTNEQIFKLAPIGAELPVLGKVVDHDINDYTRPVSFTENRNDDNCGLASWPHREAIIEAIQIKGRQNIFSRNSEGLLSFPLTVDKILNAAPLGSELYGLGTVIGHDNESTGNQILPIKIHRSSECDAEWPHLIDILNAIFFTKYPQLRPEQSECTKDPEGATDVPMESPSPKFTTADGFAVSPGEEVWSKHYDKPGKMIHHKPSGGWVLVIGGEFTWFEQENHSSIIYKHKPVQTKTIEVPAGGFTTEWFFEKFPVGMDLGEYYGKVIQHHPNEIDELIETEHDYLNPFKLINLYITKPELFTSKNAADNE